MKKPLSRRDFLKAAAMAAGGITTLGMGNPIPFRPMRAEATFDPNDSFWAKEQPPANPALQKDITTEVAIIGGGYTGLSTAWHLAQFNPKLDIVILEARQLGNGASGRHGGMVLSQTASESFEIASDSNEKIHKWTYDLTVNSMRSLEKLVKASGVDCGLELNGFCYAIIDEGDLEDDSAYVAKVRRLGMPLEFWDADKTAEKLGTAYYSGAIYDPNGGHVHAMKLIKALKKMVEAAGVRIYENSPVTKIEEGKTIHLKVGTQGNTVSASSIVLATNGYTGELGYFKNQVIPVHAQCAVTPPLSKKQLAGMSWESRLPFFDSRYLLYHLVLTQDNRIVIGGGSADYFMFDNLHYQGNLVKIGNTMLQEMVHIYPALRGIQFEQVWDGILAMTYDEYEAAGVMGANRNIYYGLGYCGHGVNSSFMFGNVIASTYNHVKSGWERTVYANEPLASMPPDIFKWLGVNGITTYYRWQDGK